jgi:AcrR family transcriptional regulator
MDVKDRILLKAHALYMRYGVKSISMDDIANELGISKKTIYQYYERKADMVMEVSRFHFKAEKEISSQVMQQSENPVHELILSLRQFQQTFRNISTKIIYEIQKYYPEAWVLFEDFKQNYVLPIVEANLRQGIDQGFYRKDIDISIVAQLRVTQMEIGFRQEFFPTEQFNPRDVQIEMFRLYMYGLVTDEGRKLLDHYIQQAPEQSPIVHSYLKNQLKHKS